MKDHKWEKHLFVGMWTMSEEVAQQQSSWNIENAISSKRFAQWQKKRLDLTAFFWMRSGLFLFTSVRNSQRALLRNQEKSVVRQRSINFEIIFKKKEYGRKKYRKEKNTYLTKDREYTNKSVIKWATPPSSPSHPPAKEVGQLLMIVLGERMEINLFG